jgi:hypothetical protein
MTFVYNRKATVTMEEINAVGSMAIEPRCDARTLFFFEKEEEISNLIDTHGHGSIFTTKSGQLTQVAKNLYVAFRHGLGYDIAGEVFVCSKCRTSAPNIVYFRANHDICDELVRRNEAVLVMKTGTKTVPAFPILPSYATPEEEQRILRWLRETENRIYADIVLMNKEVWYEKSGERINEVITQQVQEGKMNEEQERDMWFHTMDNEGIRPSRRYAQRKVMMNTKNLEMFVLDVIKDCADRKLPVEFIDDRRRKNFVKVPLNHMRGHQNIDPNNDIPDGSMKFLNHYGKIIEPTMRVFDMDITNGWSGVVFHPDDLPDYYKSRCIGGMFVVLGRCKHGILQNALGPRCCEGLTYYSKFVNEKFPKPKHQCDALISEEAIQDNAFKLYKSLSCVRDLRCSMCHRMHLVPRASAEEGEKVWQSLAQARKETQDFQCNRVAEVFRYLLDMNAKLQKETQTDKARVDIGKIEDPQFQELIEMANNIMNDVQTGNEELKRFAQVVRDQQMRIQDVSTRNLELQAVDLWRTTMSVIHIPNRKLYLPGFTDTFGNFLFFPGRPMPQVFENFMMPVEHYMDFDGQVKTNHRFVDQEGKVRTCVEGLYRKYGSNYFIEQNKKLLVFQPLNECHMDIGHTEPICHWEGDTPLYSQILMPTPRHLRFGVTNRLLRIQNVWKETEWVAKNGMCYLYILACAIMFCDSERRDSVDLYIKREVEYLKEWPTFSDVLGVLRVMVVAYGCYDAPVPTILVNHIDKTMHVVGPYGIQAAGYHSIKVNTAGDLMNLDAGADGPMKQYRIGGEPSGVTGRPVYPDGMCYGQIFSKMSASLDSTYRLAFGFKVAQAFERLGKFPKMCELVVEVNLLAMEYDLMDMEIPPCSYNNITHLYHFYVGERNDDVYKISLGKVRDFVRDAMGRDCCARGLCKAGGVMEAFGEIKKCVRSKGYFVRVLNEKPKLLVDLMLSPSSLFVLGQMTEAHGILLKDVKDQQDVLFALMRLKQLSRDLGPHLSTKRRVEHYMEGIYKHSKQFLKLIQDDDERTRLEELFNLSNRAYLESQTYMDIDQFVEFKKSLEEQDDTLSESVYNEFLSSWPWHNWHGINLKLQYTGAGRRIGETLNSLSEWWSNKSTIRAPQVGDLKKSMVNGYKAATTASSCVTRYVMGYMTESVFKYIVIGFFTALGGWLLRKSIKLLKYEWHKSEEDDVAQLQGKTEEAWVSKFMAMCFIITTFFSQDLSSSIYSSMIKFRTIFSILDYGAVYQAGNAIFGNMLDHLKDVPTFHEIYLYDHERTVARTDPVVTYFGKWFDSRVINGQFGIDPLEGIHEELRLTFGTHDQVATDLAKSSSREFLVIGDVGSGKSTKLTARMSSYGRVLICEPTRVLVTNLRDSMQKVNGFQPSTVMRNHRIMTNSNVTVMTYGYALHYLYHQTARLQDYDYICFDEVHHTCAEKVVLYNWLKQIGYDGKIVKMTATNHKAGTDYVPQHDVPIKTFDRIDCQAFMEEQKMTTKHDVSSFGKTILVFLTSYREIDRCAEILQRKQGITVIKADARSLRNKDTLVDHIESATTPNVYILATNILQNGVNLVVDVVVDFGQKIISCYDADNRMITTRRVAINRSDRIQRLGRVGRMKTGYAFKIGKEVAEDFEIDEVTATEAALIAFGYGVNPLIRNVDVNLFRNTTVQQVRTASKFELPVSYMVWMVNNDGSMPRAFYELFRHILLNEGRVELTRHMYTRSESTNWRTIEDYKYNQYVRIQEFDSRRIPFHANDISDDMVLKLATAVVQSEPPRYTLFRVPDHDLREAALKLSTKKEDLELTLININASLDKEQELLAQFQDSQTRCSAESFPLFPSCQVQTQLQKKIALISQNIDRLKQHKSALERACTAEGHDQLLAFLTENQDVAAHVMYQSGSSDFIDYELLRKRKYPYAPYIALFVAFVFVCVTWFMLYLRRNKAHYEGKKGRIQRDRSKRMTAFHGEGNDQYIEARDGFYNATRDVEDPPIDWEDVIRSKKDKSRMTFGPTEINRGGRPQYVFKNFYGFDPKSYDTVTFTDIQTQCGVDQNAKAIDLSAAFERMKQERIERDYDNIRPREVRALFRKNATGEIREVMLTPHDPHLASAKGLPMGYRDHQGEWRQTGQSTVLPMTAQFESQALYKEPRDLNHLFNAQGLIERNNCGVLGFVSGNHLFGPFHFTMDIDKEDHGRATFHARFGYFALGDVRSVKVKKFEGIDLVALEMPTTFRPQRKIKSLRTPVVGEKAVLLATSRVDGMLKNMISGETEVKPSGFGISWNHFVSTKEGHCGGFLVAVNDSKVIGFHSAGATNKNFFFPVTNELIKFMEEPVRDGLIPWKFSREMLDYGSLKLQNSQSAFPMLKSLLELGFAKFENGPGRTVKYCGGGLIAKAMSSSQLHTKHVIKGARPQFNAFLASNPEIEKQLQCHLGKMQPSALNYEAYYKDILKYDKAVNVGTINECCFKIAFDNVVSLLKAAGFKERSCRYIFDCGKIVNDLNMNAAMGALYGGKKKAWFGEASDEMINDLFDKSCAKLAANGHGIWSGLLKAELRPAEKVRENKTRTFTSAPVDVLLGAKVTVDEFNNQFYDKHLKGPWTVGINKFNRGWDILANSLMKYKKYIDADGSRFDSSLTPYMFNAVLNIRLTFQEDDDVGELMLRNLYTQIVYTHILAADGLIFQKFRGNNSGQPSTVVDNTLCLMLAMEYSRARAEEEGFECQMLYVCNGDDLLINCDEETQLWISTRFETYFTELELIYDFSEVHDDLSTVEFMSHRFYSYKDSYIPKLKEHRIVSILEWERSKDVEAFQSALTAAYIESFGYDHLMGIIENFVQDLNKTLDFELPTRQEVEDLYLTGKVSELGLHILAVDDEMAWYESGNGGGNGNGNGNGGNGNGNGNGAGNGNGSGRTGNDPPPPRPRTPPPAGGGNGNGRTGNDPPPRPRQQDPPPPPPPRVEPSLDRDPMGNGTGRGGGGGRGRDVDDRAGSLVLPQPKTTSQALYLPRAVRRVVNDEVVAQIRGYIPRREQIDAQWCSEEQLEHWIGQCGAAFGQSPDEFCRTLLPAWIVWCIVNTCSPENKKLDKWRAVQNVGQENEKQVSYDILPMYNHAKPSLRAVMRHFGDIARLIIAESASQGKLLMPKAVDKTGLFRVEDSVAACDFIMRKQEDGTSFVQIQNQVTVNRLAGIRSRLFGQAKLSQGTNVDEERHDATDVEDGVHGYRGASLR